MKKIKIAIEDDKVAVNFDGFSGQDCFLEAGELNAILKKQGIEIDNPVIQPKEGDAINGQPRRNSYVKK